MTLTAERLRETLDYDPETGNFHHRLRQTKKVGAVTHDGRIQIYVDRHFYYAHRLAWLWMTGSWPDRQIDHINRNPLDNRFANLRLATGSQNTFNRGIDPRNTSGSRGVFFDIRYKRPWRAVLARKIVGRYATKEEATEAFRKAASEVYGEFHA